MKEEAVLVVDDELDARNLLSKVLQKEGFEPCGVETGEAALEALRKRQFAAILLDYQLPGQDGLKILERILNEDPETQVIMVTSHGSIKLAVEAVKIGAHDFLAKPFDLDEVRIAVRNAVTKHRMWRENARLRNLTLDEHPQPYVLGVSPQMREIWKTVDRVASSNATVLVEGESGTGKEVVAKTIHQKSPRRAAPFIAMNCAALTRELVESELFGHVKGAFTGAIDTKKGRFEAADGGTLFLDEIGELAPELQAKLLRVLQEGAYERVGDTKSRQVDVRILGATNRDLEAAVKDKTFREDLFYRLNVIRIKMPALRERREDIPGLVEFFLARCSVERGKAPATLTPEAQRFLLTYNYPGNIRELSNMLERATILSTNQAITISDLVPQYHTDETASSAKMVEVLVTNFSEAKAQFECNHLMRLLAMTRGNVSLAARLAAMDRNNFKDKMRKYGIESQDFRE